MEKNKCCPVTFASFEENTTKPVDAITLSGIESIKV